MVILAMAVYLKEKKNQSFQLRVIALLSVYVHGPENCPNNIITRILLLDDATAVLNKTIKVVCRIYINNYGRSGVIDNLSSGTNKLINRLSILFPILNTIILCFVIDFVLPLESLRFPKIRSKFATPCPWIWIQSLPIITWQLNIELRHLKNNFEQRYYYII